MKPRLARRAFLAAVPTWGSIAAALTLAGILLGSAAIAGARGTGAFSDLAPGVGFGRQVTDLAVPLLGALAGATAFPARYALLTRRAALSVVAGRAGAVAAGVAVGVGLAEAVLLAAGRDAAPFSALGYVLACALGAAAFAAVGLLCAALAGPARPAVAVAGAAGVVVLLGPVWDTALFAAAFQSVGLAGLQGGTMPTWILASQAFNPLTAMKGMQATWEPGFASAIEREVMRRGLPAYVNPGTFAAILVVWTAGVAWVGARFITRQDVPDVA